MTTDSAAAALVLYEYEASSGAAPIVHAEAFAAEADAWRYAVNEWMMAVHDALPATSGEARGVLDRSFTLLSEASLPYPERHDRVAPMWRRYRELAGPHAARSRREPAAALRQVIVLRGEAIPRIAHALAQPRPPRPAKS